MKIPIRPGPAHRARHFEGKTLRKEIVIPGKIVNLVVGGLPTLPSLPKAAQKPTVKRYTSAIAQFELVTGWPV